MKTLFAYTWRELKIMIKELELENKTNKKLKGYFKVKPDGYFFTYREV